jgi:glycosyltransferase involved in cell wall biosynthesis
MRVLHVIADLGSYGAERFLALLVRTLRDPDIELAVMTIYSTPGGAPELGVPVLDVARRGRYDLAFLPRMIGRMRAWKPDVVHTHMHNGKYWGRIAALASGVKTLVHTEHNSEFGAPGAFRLVNRALIARTDAVVAFSQTHRAALAARESIPLERIVVIPNGIALAPLDGGERERARAALGAHDGERILLHVGRLSAVKNQQLAIEALALLPPPARLVFAGEGADRAALESLARERGVAARVTFLGYRTDAAALIAGADAALVTSLNEAMPLAVIEAMAAGAPLASVPWHGAREMLGEGAFGTLAADYTPDALAAAVRAVLDDPSAARERADRARAFAREEYDIATTARRHAALYRELSARSRSAKPLITAARS